MQRSSPCKVPQFHRRLLLACTTLLPIIGCQDPLANSSHPSPPESREEKLQGMNPSSQTQLQPYLQKAQLARPHLEKALQLRREGKLEEAVDEYNAALGKVSEFGETAGTFHTLLGEILCQQGKYRESLQALDAAKGPGQSDVRTLTISICYLELGDVPQAKQFFSPDLLRRGLVEFEGPSALLPRVTDSNMLAYARLARAFAYHQSGDYKPAELDYASARALIPDEELLQYQYGRLLRVMGRRREALVLFRSASHSGRQELAARANQAAEKLDRYPDAH
jgi:Tfp pilus assembly protein PilF